MSVASADTRIHLIGQRNYGEKGDTPGGDGMRAANDMMAKAEAMGMDVFSIRKNFLTTASLNGRSLTIKTASKLQDRAGIRYFFPRQARLPVESYGMMMKMRLFGVPPRTAASVHMDRTYNKTNTIISAFKVGVMGYPSEPFRINGYGRAWHVRHLGQMVG